jgi:hypothetical protein
VAQVPPERAYAEPNHAPRAGLAARKAAPELGTARLGAQRS